MRVIGVNGQGRHIVEMCNGELQNLLGYYSQYDTEPNSIIQRSLDKGVDIPIHDMYHQLYRMAERKKEIDDIKTKLTQIVAGLDVIYPILEGD